MRDRTELYWRARYRAGYNTRQNWSCVLQARQLASAWWRWRRKYGCTHSEWVIHSCARKKAKQFYLSYFKNFYLSLITNWQGRIKTTPEKPEKAEKDEVFLRSVPVGALCSSHPLQIISTLSNFNLDYSNIV